MCNLYTAARRHQHRPATMISRRNNPTGRQVLLVASTHVFPLCSMTVPGLGLVLDDFEKGVFPFLGTNGMQQGS